MYIEGSNYRILNLLAMYEWMMEWQNVAKNPYYFSLAESGVNESDIEMAEKRLGVALPDSYKSFIRKWNGAELPGSRILSLEEVVEFAAEWGFSPYQGYIEITDERQRHSFANKPAHHLIFRMYELSTEALCFDTSSMSNNEYGVCFFQEDQSISDSLYIHFPSFYLMLVHDLYFELLMDTDFMQDPDQLTTEAELESLEEERIRWVQKFEEILLSHGVLVKDAGPTGWEEWPT